MLFDNDKEAEDEYPYMHQYTNYMKKMTRPLVGREHEKEQVMAAMLKPEYCNVLLLGEAGSGKAQPNDTLVPVADERGYVRIGDLKPGDFVFDENGDPTEVLGVFPQGMQECFEVGFTDGTAAKCNDRHLWQARRRGRHDSYDVHTLRYMMAHGGDAKTKKSGKAKPAWEVPVNHALDRSEAKFEKDPYQAGRDACDGHSCDREVPREYIKGSMAQRIMLLHGLMDANGDVAVYGKRACAFFSTGIKALADFVRELAASLGYRTVLHTDDGYHVSFVTDADESRALFSGRSASEKVEKLIAEGRKFPKRPKSVGVGYMKDLGYECEMTCIYVAAESHLYQTGKEHIITHNTALVQGIMVMDTDRMYLEVDLSKMIANLKNENEMADRLKTLFDEVSRFKNARNKEIVLFIDEFHQIVQLSPAAVEVLKPLLADSGTRGIRVIAATTHVEYQQFIAPNLPLVERLQRIKLVQPGEDVVISILKSMCDRYGVVPASPELFSEIYEYTNRYIPATSQPRKSILILDSMIGWHRLTRKPLDRKLLADVIYETEGINVAFRVNAATIKKKLDEKVLAQQVATSSIEQRLQICVAGLNNPNRPMSSFLFAGSTGVGKGYYDEELIPIYENNGNIAQKRNGDLEIGDYVFNRKGEPVKVVGVFHRGLQDVYRVTLGDGRSVIVDGSHLWAWKFANGHDTERYVLSNTEDILNQGLYTNVGKNGRRTAKFWIPMNEAMQYPERTYSCHPYVVGAVIGNGCLTMGPMLIISSGNKFVPEKIAGLIGAAGTKQSGKNYDWAFVSEYGALRNGKRDKLLGKEAVLREASCLDGLKSHEKYIPDPYKYGSVEQRWSLIQGLFDTDGTICQSDGDRFNVSYSTTSERLAKDVQEVLFSLGIASSISNHGDRDRDGDVHAEFDVHVKVHNDKKHMFFTYPKKHDLAMKAQGVAKQRQKMFDCVQIASIEKLPEKLPTTCIMVDDYEHLYQGPNGVVSHNTEATKQLANILYDDDRNLIRFDMTEFALPDSLNRFRKELTNRVSTIPYCLILFDEIEKACGPVTRVLLQVLDDGRLLDENEREVTFKNAYIIVTTNSGAEIFRTISNYESSDKADMKTLEKYDKLLREAIKNQSGSKFPPELLGRIDCIVPFQPLSRKTMMGIVQMKLKGLAKTVKAKHGVSLHIHKDIYMYLIYDKLDTDSDSGGARIVVSKLERELTVPLARYINEHPNQKEIFVSIGGKMAIENKRQLESEAYVYVGSKFLRREDESAVVNQAQAIS